MGKSLIAGPWLGEFGWELMTWQGALRQHLETCGESYDDVYVLTRNHGSGFLYEDMSAVVVKLRSEVEMPPASCDLTPGLDGQVYDDYRRSLKAGHSLNCETYRQIVVNNAAKNLGIESYDAFGGLARPPEYQKFVRLGKETQALAFDVVIHARQREAWGSDFYNWPMERWVELVERNQDLSFCCIGKSPDSAEVPGVQSFVDAPLETTSDVLASSRVVMGPSSGPIHLAALCGTPTVCWTDFNRVGRWGLTNEMRLREKWNPFDVPVYLHDGWQPTVDWVSGQIPRAIESNQLPERMTWHR